MTIAAGLLLRDGVLLCADTEYTGAQHKSQDSKIDHFVFPSGKIAYALAGNEETARATIDKLHRELLAMKPGDLVRDLIDRVIDRQYRKHASQGDALDFQLLLAYKGDQNQRADLYVTRRTTVRPVRRFSCIGYGAEFASHILRPQFHALASDRDMWHLSAYMMAVVKRSVPYCGGESLLLILKNNGDVGIATSEINNMPVRQIEDFSKNFDWLAHKLFLALVDPAVTGKQFSDTVDDLKRVLLANRELWEEERDKWCDSFRRFNPGLAPEAALIAYLAWSMGLSPGNLPPKQTTTEATQ